MIIYIEDDFEGGIEITDNLDHSEATNTELSFANTLFQTVHENLAEMFPYKDFEVEEGYNKFYVQISTKVGDELTIKFGPVDSTVTATNVRLTTAWHTFMHVVSYIGLILDAQDEPKRTLH